MLNALRTDFAKDPSLVEGGEREERETIDSRKGQVTEGKVHHKHVGRRPQGLSP